MEISDEGFSVHPAYRDTLAPLPKPPWFSQSQSTGFLATKPRLELNFN